MCALMAPRLVVRVRLVGLSVVLSLLAACTGGSPDERDRASITPSPVRQSAAPRVAVDEDPGPRLPRDGTRMGAGGGKLSRSGVDVQVPPGAVGAGESIEVRVGAPVGQLRGSFAAEVAGRPVAVDHAVPLRQPLRLTWQLPELTTAQRDALILVRWDQRSRTWAPSSEPVRWSGSTLSVNVSRFSIVDWMSGPGAKVSQKVGVATGTRVDSPACSGRLPGWVRGTVDPDEDLTAAAVRVCFAPDKNEIVTVKVANNRVFTQQMAMTGTDKWAWTRPPAAGSGPAAAVYLVANDVFDDDRHMLVPPLETAEVESDDPRSPDHISSQPPARSTY